MMVALLKNSGPHFRAFEIYRESQGARLAPSIFSHQAHQAMHHAKISK